MSQNIPDESTPDGTNPDGSTPVESVGADSASTKRSGVPKALAITGVAVGAVLLLGLVFGGGVALGRILPDGRGPVSIIMGGGPGGDRDGGRGPSADHRDGGLTDEQREQFRDEMIERWQELQQENG